MGQHGYYPRSNEQHPHSDTCRQIDVMKPVTNHLSISCRSPLLHYVAKEFVEGKYNINVLWIVKWRLELWVPEQIRANLHTVLQ